MNNSLLDWDEIIRSRNSIVVDVDAYSEGINLEVNGELLNETLYDSWIATGDIEPIGSLVLPSSDCLKVINCVEIKQPADARRSY